MLDRIETPQLARPAFVSWQSGVGQQQFPNDPVLEAARHRALKAAGLIKTRRIPREEAA